MLGHFKRMTTRFCRYYALFCLQFVSDLTQTNLIGLRFYSDRIGRFWNTKKLELEQKHKKSESCLQSEYGQKYRCHLESRVTTQDQSLSPKRLTSDLASLPAANKNNMTSYLFCPILHHQLFASIFMQKKVLPKSSRHQSGFPWDNHVNKIRKIRLPLESGDSNKYLKQPNNGISFVQPNSHSDELSAGSDTAPGN